MAISPPNLRSCLLQRTYGGSPVGNSILFCPVSLAVNLRPRETSFRATSVNFLMAAATECNQVVHHVAAQFAPGFYMMDLQVFHGTALLTPPTISFQDLVSDHYIAFRVQLEPGSFFAYTHRIRCAPHRKTYRRVSPRVAPARKSAQIISKQ
jgi:hypothetical protein